MSTTATPASCRSSVTAAVRAGIDRDTAFGAVTPPLVLSSNFSFEGFGNKRQYDYTRSGNPTRDLLGEALAELEGGAGGVVTATGMGAMVSSLLGSLPESGGLDDVEADADGIRRSGQDAIRYVLDEPVSGPQEGVALTAFTVSKEDGRLLTVETESAGTKAVVTLSEMGEVDPVQAPPADEVLKQDG